MLNVLSSSLTHSSYEYKFAINFAQFMDMCGRCENSHPAENKNGKDK